MKDITAIRLDGIKLALVTPFIPPENLYGEWNLSSVDSVSPPIGLLCLAAMVRKHGGEVSICDAYARRLDVEQTVEEVLSGAPTAIGVTCMTPSYPAAKVLIEKFKRAAPGVSVILGGSHVSALRSQVMLDIPTLDYAVINEGEITIIDILDIVRSGRDASTVEGIIYRNDGPKETEPRDFIKNMDTIPYPAWDLLPSLAAPYQMSIIGVKNRAATSLITTRGCPCNCTFCDVSGVGRKVRGYSAEYVIGMMEHLIQNYGIRDFLIYDDTFVALRQRTKVICEEIIRKKWKINWSCCARVDMVNPETLDLMKRAGCWQIEYGIESGSQKIINLMEKRIDTSRIRKALKWTKDAGIETRGNFIFGYLGETAATLEETIDFAMSLDLDFFQQTFLTPYPGSQIYHEAEKYGVFEKDLEKMNNLTINFIPDGMTKEELKRYSAVAFRRFYLRPRIIMHHLKKVTSINGSRNLALAFIAFLKTTMRVWKTKTVPATGSLAGR